MPGPHAWTAPLACVLPRSAAVSRLLKADAGQADPPGGSGGHLTPARSPAAVFICGLRHPARTALSGGGGPPSTWPTALGPCRVDGPQGGRSGRGLTGRDPQLVSALGAMSRRLEARLGAVCGRASGSDGRLADCLSRLRCLGWAAAGPCTAREGAGPGLRAGQASCCPASTPLGSLPCAWSPSVSRSQTCTRRAPAARRSLCRGPRPCPPDPHALGVCSLRPQNLKTAEVQMGSRKGPGDRALPREVCGKDEANARGLRSGLGCRRLASPHWASVSA